MIGWASVIHNLLFQVQSVQNQCPVASTTWGQGIMVDVMVMFVVLIHVWKTIGIWLWPFSDVSVLASGWLDSATGLWTAWSLVSCHSLANGIYLICFSLHRQGETMQAAWFAKHLSWCRDASSGMPSCTWIAAIMRLQYPLKVCYSPLSSSIFANLMSFCNRYFQ